MMDSSELVAGPTPFSPALKAISSTGFWNETQWAVFISLMEAAMPAIATESTIEDKHNQIQISDREFDDIFKRVTGTVTEPPSKEALRAFLAERCTADPDYVDSCKRHACSLPPTAAKELGGLLNLLAYVYATAASIALPSSS